MDPELGSVVIPALRPGPSSGLLEMRVFGFEPIVLESLNLLPEVVRRADPVSARRCFLSGKSPEQVTTLLSMATARPRVMYMICPDVGAIEDDMGRGATLRAGRATRGLASERQVRLCDASRQGARL